MGGTAVSGRKWAIQCMVKGENACATDTELVGSGSPDSGPLFAAALPFEMRSTRRLRSSPLSLTIYFLWLATILPLSVKPDQARISVRGRMQRITLDGASH